MSATAEPILVLNRVDIGYQPTQPLLRDISLSLPAGCFAALLGPNGTGKSTLLKTILGLLPPLTGKIQLGNVGARKAILGYVPQRDALDPLYPVTCLELVLMGCCAWKPAGHFWNKADHQWALDCLQKVGGASWSHQNFAQLSGGQAQRVLLARALAGKPDLLVMDEPTAGIDNDALASISQLWRDLHQSSGLSILTVSHDLSWVHQNASLILTLENHSIRATENTPLSPVPTPS